MRLGGRGLKLFAALSGMALLSLGPPPPAPQGACFNRQDNKLLPFDVFQVGAPPPYSPLEKDYPATSPVYPATDFTTTAISLIKSPLPRSASGLTFRRHFLLWVNRCNQIPGLTPSTASCRNRTMTKGNGYFQLISDGAGEKVRVAFSTYAKANACTLIQARRVLGDPAGLATSARLAGVKIWDGADRIGLAKLAQRVPTATGQTVSYIVDTCILEATPQAADADGIVLDYEVWDNRTPAEALDFIRILSRLIHRHGKSVILITDPLPKGPSGLTSDNIRPMIAVLDGFGSAIATGASMGNPTIHYPAKQRVQTPFTAYLKQLAILTDDGRNPLTASEKRKLIWDVSLYDTALPEGQQLHDEFRRQGYRGILLARNFLREGGACQRPENQTIACFTLGQCDGQFGLARH